MDFDEDILCEWEDYCLNIATRRLDDGRYCDAHYDAMVAMVEEPTPPSFRGSPSF